MEWINDWSSGLVTRQPCVESVLSRIGSGSEMGV